MSYTAKAHQSHVPFAEKAEQAVKEAAEEMNKQLPKEAQGGSMQPLVEEKEEGEGQALDTFSAEIDALDQVHFKKWCELGQAALQSMGSYTFRAEGSYNT